MTASRHGEKPTEALDRSFYIRIRDRVVTAFVVCRIADYRMIDRCEMNSDLMCATGLDIDIDEREFFKPLANFPDR